MREDGISYNAQLIGNLTAAWVVNIAAFRAAVKLSDCSFLLGVVTINFLT